jgi:hypothetical protein
VPDIAEVTQGVTEASFDCTFKSVPSSTGAKQLLTMHIRKQDHVSFIPLHLIYLILETNFYECINKLISVMFQSFPVAYALMTHKTYYAYEAVLQYIKSLCPNLALKDAFSDYETALQQAISYVFPGVRVHGCWFHFAQVFTFRK